MSSILEIGNEELRSLVLDALKKDMSTQFGNLYITIANLASQRGLFGTKKNSNIYNNSNNGLERSDCAKVQNILWDLIIEGIIRPGLNDGVNNNLPFFHVTDKGKEVLENGMATPYDPDRYMKRLSDNISNIDSVIIVYLNECLNTFRIGSLLSATITLGVASEKALLLLIDACASAIADQNKKKRFIDDTQSKTIKRQYDEFVKLYKGKLKELFTGDINEDFETTVNGIFMLIRNYRNEAGHPTGRMVPRDVVYANIQVFPTYLKKIYSAIEWLSSNNI